MPAPAQTLAGQCVSIPARKLTVGTLVHVGMAWQRVLSAPILVDGRWRVRVTGLEADGQCLNAEPGQYVMVMVPR